MIFFLLVYDRFVFLERSKDVVSLTDGCCDWLLRFFIFALQPQL